MTPGARNSNPPVYTLYLVPPQLYKKPFQNPPFVFDFFCVPFVFCPTLRFFCVGGKLSFVVVPPSSFCKLVLPMFYVVDTNVWLLKPDFYESYRDGVVVIQELDKHKGSFGALGTNARLAARTCR